MPQKYRRKTSRGTVDVEKLRIAAIAVEDGESVRGAARRYDIDRTTLRRYMDGQLANPGGSTGYINCQLKNMVFNQQMERELADHIKEMGKRFHGLSKLKCQQLAYEFARQNNVKMPDTWKINEKAGQSFWLGFKSRQNLAIRSPKSTSLARATAFNRHTVGEFFRNLATVMDAHRFEPQDIYNVDETITSAERGQLVTVINTINASGRALPPFFIFPIVNFSIRFLDGAPFGSDGTATKSGCVTEDTFSAYLDHLIKHTRCSAEHKMLLILDNNEAHISLAAIDKAKANGIVLLSIPPHTSHKLQPLDVAVYGPYKRAYARAVDCWMWSNPAQTLSIFDIAKLVNDAHVSACVPRNIFAGFRSSGIYPYNDIIFSDDDFAAATVTDRDCPAKFSQQNDTSTPPAHDSLSPSNRDDYGNDEPRPSTSACRSLGYVSPSDIHPLPKAAARKEIGVNRRRRTTRILTGTPVRDEIAALAAARKITKRPKSKTGVNKCLFEKNQKRKPKRKCTKTYEESSSDSEANNDIEFAESASSESEDLSMIAGNFMIVKVSGKSRIANYIARADVVEDNNVEGVFLKRVPRPATGSDPPTFVVDSDDEGMWAKEDVAKVLPRPVVCGMSRRTSYQFPCDLDEWNLQ